MDAKADLSLRVAHMPLCLFDGIAAHVMLLLSDFAPFRRLGFVILISVQQLAVGVQPSGQSNSRKNLTNKVNEPHYCLWCRCQDLDQEYFVDCSNLGLYKIPEDLDNKTIVLNMKNNIIRKLTNFSFYGNSYLKELILAHNKLYFIETDTFKSLVSLELLDLSDNEITALQDVLTPGLFSSLGQLKYLYLHKNVIYRPYALLNIPESPITEAISLEHLSIDGVISAPFGPAYKNLTKLISISMSGSTGNCQIDYLKRFTFQNVPALEHLVLDKCRIKQIDTDTFSYVPRLKYLDLSWNDELEFKTFGEAAFGLKFTELQELKINAIHHPYRAGTEILRENMPNIRELKLKILHMDDNGIEYIDYGVPSMLPPTLTHLSLRRNRLNFGFWLEELIFNNPELVILDAGDQEEAIGGYFKNRKRRESSNSSTVKTNTPNKAAATKLTRYKLMTFQDRKDLPNKNSKHNVNKNLQGKLFSQTKRSYRVKRSAIENEPPEYDYDESVPLQLQTMICSGSKSKFHLFDFVTHPNNITKIDISRNYIPDLREGAFSGLDNMQTLNLSSNDVEHIDRNAFAGLQNLKTLDLADNFLGFELRSDFGATIFSHFHHLSCLNLSHNRITEIPFKELDSLVHLKILDLSHNYLNSFDVRVTHLKHLRILDLSDNKIQCLQDEVRRGLDAISESHPLSLRLEDNNLLCTCETQPFLKWLVSTKIDLLNFDNYYCSLNNGSVRFLNETHELLSYLNEDCRSYFHVTLGSSSGISIIFTLVLFYTTYRNRWKLRYMYYMAKVKLDINQEDNTQSHSFQFDAFISYADRDTHFVTRDMVEKLEETAGLRLVIRDRDYELGESIAINISKAIRYSRKTLLLLSRNFLLNKWCDFELNMAQM
ncbi:MAG: leucine-rich repeat domain-containing protein, partial [Candidatus Thiodiazotropha sp.]